MSRDLMDAPRCVAIAKGSGQRCKRRPIPGGRVCVMHGGAAPAVRAAAQQRLAEAEAAAQIEVLWDVSVAPVTDPVGALQRLAGKLEHAGDVLGARVSTTDLDGPTALAFTKILQQLSRSLEVLERLDLATRHVEVQEQQAGLMLAWLQAGVEAGRALADGSSPGEVVDAVLAGFMGAMRRARSLPGGDVVRGEVE